VAKECERSVSKPINKLGGYSFDQRLKTRMQELAEAITASGELDCANLNPGRQE